MDQHNFVDYYQVLQCDKNATNIELKKSYQRLVLALHPDKSREVKDEDTFLLVQKAWSVLRDQETRKKYDAELSFQEHNEVLLYETVSLAEMEFNSQDNYYAYTCRCGGTYLFEKCVPMPAQTIIECDECSLSIQVNL